MDQGETIDAECRRCELYRDGRCLGDKTPCVAFSPFDLELYGDDENQTTGEFPPGSPEIETGRDGGVPPHADVPAGNSTTTGLLNRHAGCRDTVAARRALQRAMQHFNALGHSGPIIRTK